MTDDELIARYIVQDRHFSGPHHARLRDSLVPVVPIIKLLRCYNDDAAQVAPDFGVSVEAIEAAKAYYRRHRDVIDARILLDESIYA